MGKGRIGSSIAEDKRTHAELADHVDQRKVEERVDDSNAHKGDALWLGIGNRD